MRIQGKENLKVINLKDNPIKNFHELFNIIIHFPKLEKLILINCGIKEKEILEMKIKIIKEYNLEFEIKI